MFSVYFFYISNAIVYVFCTYYVFSSFLCCNASAFVICAIKNYLLTYLLCLWLTSLLTLWNKTRYAKRHLHAFLYITLLRSNGKVVKILQLSF